MLSLLKDGLVGSPSRASCCGADSSTYSTTSKTRAASACIVRLVKYSVGKVGRYD
jgi:hypothetical protein